MSHTFTMAPLSERAMLMNWLILVPVVLLMLVVTFSLLWFIQAANGVRFEINDQALQIRYPFYGRSLARTELRLDQAKIVDLARDSAYRPVLRTNGVGLIGFGAGWFRLKNKDKALAFYSAQQQAVYIPTTRNFVLLLCPQEPERFLAELQQAG